MSRRSNRMTAGVHNGLATDFVYPDGFGAGRHSVSNPELNETTSSTMQTTIMNMDAVGGDDSTSGVSRSSSTVTIERRRLQSQMLALQQNSLIEQQKRQLQLKQQELEDQQKVIALQQRIDDLECDEDIRSNKSRSRLLTEKKSNVTAWLESVASGSKRQSNASLNINNGMQLITHAEVHGPPELDIPQQLQLTSEHIARVPTVCNTSQSIQVKVNPVQMPEKVSPEVEMICSTMSNVLKSLNVNQNKLMTRQILDKDLPFFDGTPEDWPVFINEFNIKSQSCQYSQSEQLFKLQRCLKGDAKATVSGMLAIPANVPSIIKTLELRFGRIDIIINRLIQKTKLIPPVKENHLESLINLSMEVTNLTSTIINSRANEHLQNPQLLEDLVTKLPDIIKLQWGQCKLQRNGKVDLSDFSSWLADLANALCYVTTPKMISDVKLNRPKRNTVMLSQETAEKSPSEKEKECIYCKANNHSSIPKCPVFKTDSAEVRWENVGKIKTLCFSCLQPGHHIGKCRKRKFCGVSNCKRYHHPMLHRNISQVPEHSQRTDDQPRSSAHQNKIEVSLNTHSTNNVLLRVVPVILYGPKGQQKTHAIFDDASTVTLIDENLANLLGVEGKIQKLCLQWTNNATATQSDSRIVSCEISGDAVGSKVHSLKNARTMKGLRLPSQSIIMAEWEKYPHLRNLPVRDIVNARPMILIGQDHADLIVARKVSQGPSDVPMATKTKLGWVNPEDENLGNLEQLVKESFTTDNFGVIPHDHKPSNDERRALQILESTTKQVEDRFETGLLWRHDNIVLPESKTVALQRLLCTERKMSKCNEYAKQYCNKIDEYIQKGYVRKLTNLEVSDDSSKTWYLPHFGVVNPNKPDKLRLVFDAAAKANGTSLNDNLLQGPDLLTSLISVLWKFRQYKVAFCGDIREMFHQVKVRDEDLPAMRFLWRNGETDRRPEVYQMTVMTFGAACSPCSAQYIKNLNARQTTTEKRILDAIENKHYVDDYLDSAATEDEAISVINKVISVHKTGGFDIVNWVTNSPKVQAALNTNILSHNDLTAVDDKSLDRILGLLWNSQTDMFCFKVQFRKISDDITNGTTRPTKRQVLRVVMSLFDPLGFLANVTIRGRIILQDIWRTTTGWDDTIPDNIFGQWCKWLEDLKGLDNIQIPRCYSYNIPSAESIEMHIFSDASESAFATVVYLRICHGEQIDTAFVTAKTRVAPVKVLSIPRLELQAALMGSRISDAIKAQLEFNIDKTFFWVDSKTVLAWIRSDGRRFKQFVAHRIGEIQELTSIEDWNYVPSKLNIADDATRLSSNNSEEQTRKWYHGPDFLRLPQQMWPNEDDKTIKLTENPELELRVEFVATISTIEEVSFLPKVENFTKWKKLLRSTVYCNRFVEIVKGRFKTKTFPTDITTKELSTAEKQWLLRSQRDCFGDEIEMLKRNVPLHKKSRLGALSPQIDKEGILRLYGRTDRANETNGFEPRPIILHPKHPYVKLLIRYYHEKYYHQGTESVVNEIRQKYWVIHLRQAVKSCSVSCQLCKNRKAKPQTPIMGLLPKERITPNVKAFAYTGIDYFGPMYVTVGRRREKRWGVLFTCLTIRAVHLEIASTLTTDSAIMAIRRMIARRGSPIKLYSDNGTNFRGASEELIKAVKDLDIRNISTEMSSRGVEWCFIPPAAPHMGGCWERLIGSVKRSLNIILKEQAPREEVLATLFAEIENTINSRPLTHVSVDPKDPESITPNHLLIGSPNRLPAPGVFTDDDMYLRKEWRKAQVYVDGFWRRWVKEYLPTLTRRNKWTTDAKPLCVGDIVLVADNDAPRNSWPKGVVTNTFPGSDGRVRVVEIRTAFGTYRRPATKICRLDLKDEDKGFSHRGEDVAAQTINDGSRRD